ncbi:hypothetical protein MY4038_008272 [Beauveria bassiana]
MNDHYRHPQSEQQPPPHSPAQPPQAYGSQSQFSYTPSGDQPMYGGMYAFPSVARVAKKNNTRTSQACDSCRRLKAKCDEAKPCTTCRDRGTECKYRDPLPKVADKTQSDILNSIAMMQGQLTTFVEHSARLNERINKMESNITNFGLGSAATTNTNAIVEEPNKTESTPFTGPPPPLGESAIPMNHTTLACLLLNWPSIQELTKHHVEREGLGYVGEFPISQEQNRGLLIVYGRGEDNRMSRKERESEQHEQQSVDVPDSSSDSPSLLLSTNHTLSPDRQDRAQRGKAGVRCNVRDLRASKEGLPRREFLAGHISHHLHNSNAYERPRRPSYATGKQ